MLSKNQAIHKFSTEITKDRADLLNQNLAFSMPTNIFCAFLILVGLHEHIDHYQLYSWFFLIIIVSVSRFCFAYFSSPDLAPEKSIQRILVGASILAVLWGMVTIFFMPKQPMLQLLIIIITIGLSSGGLQTLQADLKSSFLFFFFMLTPLSIWFFLQETFYYLLLGIASLLFYGFMLILSWRGHKLLMTNLELRYLNLDLIDQIRKKNESLTESESRFRSAFDSAAIGMALVSLEGNWLKVNRALCNIVGYSREELLKSKFQQITYPDDLELDLQFVDRLIHGEIPYYQMEKRYIHKNKNIIWVLLSVSLLRDSKNQPWYFIAQVQNIDSQKNAENELKHMAYHDVLTGLSNRKHLESFFDIALSQAERHSTSIAILFIDLDNFKEINDNFGHEIGDLLLIEVSLRLKVNLRATDMPARIGGDEFLIALTDISTIEQVETTTKKIHGAIAQPMVINEHPINISCSIGISLYPETSQDLINLIAQADKALYAVKSRGKNGYLVYSERQARIH